jgi:inorganic phosphate transporter, PiT family
MDAGLISFPLLVGLIGIALAFDFLNGLHDAANSIATVVSTRVLKPHHAVAMAASFNFLAFFLFGVHVAETIGKGIIDPEVIDAGISSPGCWASPPPPAMRWWAGCWAPAPRRRGSAPSY